MHDDLLREALQKYFGFEKFRPFQEEVCLSALKGEDLLLVMPTGSGKSLCYQLPGLMRGGAALIISPLIALMEDQVSKLQTLGIRADRFHSGMDREGVRRAGVAWRERRLDFLFVAPERLAVPWFIQFLKDYPPQLVAVDEAHCISQWGHDFRPDYRLVGERLPMPAGTPLLATTATATPRVQEDILLQLGIPSARRFIRGFRRENLAIECLEAPPSSRAAAVTQILKDPQRRPALIYAPSRKETESLALELSGIAPSAAYHAGLPAKKRDDVQSRFMSGKLEMVVATIAFGMGVDKADIRTVIHTALPGSIESYYQEIGRAGRDGDPSRAILLWSWADRRTQEYFHSKDYPEAEKLELIFSRLTEQPIERWNLEKLTGLEPETLTTCLNQLWIHGGARVDPEERTQRGAESWRKTYPLQRKHRLEQLEEICRFAGASSCRMKSLVEHFGDRSDSGRTCGLCDQCRPQDTLAVEYHAPSAQEESLMEDILAELREREGRTTGQLFKELSPGGARGDFNDLLRALAREKLVDLQPDSFVKEGREIRFERVYLGAEAAFSRETDLSSIRLISRLKSRAKSAGRARKKGPPKKKTAPLDQILDRAQENMLADLKAWRLSEARKRRIPAFRIMSDRVLEALVRTLPINTDELLEVKGIGAKLAEKYGKALLGILAGGS